MDNMADYRIRYSETNREVKYATDNPTHRCKSIHYKEDIIAQADSDINEKKEESLGIINKGINNISDKKNSLHKTSRGRVKKAVEGKAIASRKSKSKPSGIHLITGFLSMKIVPMAALVIGTVLLMLIMSLHMEHQNRVSSIGLGQGFPDDVEAWRGVVCERLRIYSEEYSDSSLEGYANVILTTIWQESDGNPNGPGVNQDIMQSRESGYWSYDLPSDWNSLAEPEKSIDAGIRYFIECLNGWDVDGPYDTEGLKMVMQEYNYGVAFLDYARSVGADKWTESLSRAYSNRMGGNYGTITYAERWILKFQTAVGGGSWIWPMPACHEISSGFGARWGTTHRGIDIPCPVGSEVLASNGGTVIHVGMYGTGGNAVIIDCGDGMKNYYYHLSRYAVSEGDIVRAGQVIAYSGNTGNSTGPHLHFGMSINGEYVDPEGYLR